MSLAEELEFIQPTVELLAVTASATDRLDGPVELIEYAGRVDYGDKSLQKMGDSEIIGRWIKSGHESMVEMADATFQITCSRVVSHELVRHRIASYQQESQRYVKYDEEEPEDLFLLPVGLSATENFIIQQAYYDALVAYKKLRLLGVKSQLARYVLPNGTRTRIIMKANLREWRHFLRLRCHPSAQPEMQVVANQILTILFDLYPEVFADVKEDIENEVRAAR
jgi:thymidylate synthase (FAD)